jgi:uncharacterized protein YkwD
VRALLDLTAQGRHAVADLAPVGFELRLAGAAQAHAAHALARKVRPGRVNRGRR